MRPYELMFIISPEVEGEEAIDSYVERFGRMVTGGGGTVTAVDKWGKKRLAYEIKGYTEGYYVVMRFKADSSVVSELNRVLKITEGVVRHMIVRLDERLLKNESSKPAAKGEAADAAPEKQAADRAAELAAPAEQAGRAEANAQAEAVEPAGEKAAATN